MDEADYGYWGFSPSNNPAGGYREYGVDQLGMDARRLHLRPGAHHRRPALRGLPRAARPRRPTYGDGVVTPHASFLALRYAPRRGAGEPGATSARNFDAYGPRRLLRRGRGRAAARSRKRYLSLDQGMVMAALGNALADDDMRRYVARGAMEQQAPAADAAGGVRRRDRPVTATRPRAHAARRRRRHRRTHRLGEPDRDPERRTPSAEPRRGSTRPGAWRRSPAAARSR